LHHTRDATATASAAAIVPVHEVIQDIAEMADYDDQRRVIGWIHDHFRV